MALFGQKHNHCRVSFLRSSPYVPYSHGSFPGLRNFCAQVARDCLLRGDDITVGNILEVFADLSAVGYVAVRGLWCFDYLRLHIGRTSFEDASYRITSMIKSYRWGTPDTAIVRRSCCVSNFVVDKQRASHGFCQVSGRRNVHLGS